MPNSQYSYNFVTYIISDSQPMQFKSPIGTVIL